MIEFLFDILSAIFFVVAIILFFRVFLRTNSIKFQFLWSLMMIFTMFFLVAYITMAYKHITGSEIADLDTIQTWTFLVGSIYVMVVAWLVNSMVDKYEQETEDEKKALKKELGTELQKQKELVRNKDHFIFVAAHELRSPITAIKWNMEMFQEGDCIKKASEDDKTIIGNLDQSVNHLTDLINDLLDTSRIEYGTFKITVESFDIMEAVQEAVDEIQYFAHEKGMVVNVEKSGEMASNVFADKKRTKEVLTNLITNSIKYNKPKGQITIAVNEKAGQVNVEVSDTGIGLSKADINKLFKKFSRIERKETAKESGTGLGLFVTHQIIQRMGGRIWVKSPGRGKGSTFGFSLPVKE